jgi:hypothetical protein
VLTVVLQASAGDGQGRVYLDHGSTRLSGDVDGDYGTLPHSSGYSVSNARRTSPTPPATISASEVISGGAPVRSFMSCRIPGVPAMV